MSKIWTGCCKISDRNSALIKNEKIPTKFDAKLNFQPPAASWSLESNSTPRNNLRKHNTNLQVINQSHLEFNWVILKLFTVTFCSRKCQNQQKYKITVSNRFSFNVGKLWLARVNKNSPLLITKSIPVLKSKRAMQLKIVF